jgi:hypothetical protein
LSSGTTTTLVHYSEEGTMATDYDAPRRNETDDMAEDSLTS